MKWGKGRVFFIVLDNDALCEIYNCWTLIVEGPFFRIFAKLGPIYATSKLFGALFSFLIWSTGGYLKYGWFSGLLFVFGRYVQICIQKRPWIMSVFYLNIQRRLWAIFLHQSTQRSSITFIWIRPRLSNQRILHSLFGYGASLNYKGLFCVVMVKNRQLLLLVFAEIRKFWGWQLQFYILRRFLI